MGIGTTSPSTKLEIDGSTSDGKIKITLNSTTHLIMNHNEIYRTGGSFYLNYNAQQDIIMCGQGGNVGIGTTSPNAPLEIHGGAGSGDEVLILSNSKDSSYTNIHALFIDGGAHYDVYNSSTIQTGKSTSNGENFHMNRYSDGDVCMCFGGGNVGIGDSTPSYKLDVNGTGRFTGDLTVGGNITVNGTTTTVSTTNMVVSDSLIELNSGASSNANDCGIVIERGSTGDNAFMGWDESADKFLMGTTTATGASTGNLSVTTGTLVANLEGSILTAAQTNITSVGTLSSLTVSGLSLIHI